MKRKKTTTSKNFTWKDFHSKSKLSLKHSHNFSHKPKIHIFGKEGRFQGFSKSHSLVETFAHYCAVFLNLSFVSLHIRWRLKTFFLSHPPHFYYQTCVEISQFVLHSIGILYIRCYTNVSLKMWNWCLLNCKLVFGTRIKNWICRFLL